MGQSTVPLKHQFVREYVMRLPWTCIVYCLQDLRAYSEINKSSRLIQAGTGIAEIIALEVSKQVSFFIHRYYVNVCQDWASYM